MLSVTHLFSILSLLSLSIPSTSAQITATFPNGPTNPSSPSFLDVGSTVNQTSDSRLITLNSVDDFCIYAPPEAGPESAIGNVEAIVVAWCTKPRNNARLIPDGTITSAHFVRTPAYVQIYGYWDGTKINIAAGDEGGELDPHGAENLGNPIGGNVTSNASGQDVFYQEWMSFVSYNQFCLRVCTAEPNGISTALMCEHQLDMMGCQWVMPGMYNDPNPFTSCDADAGAPPGLYPLANGSTSTFRQRYTGSYTQDGTQAMFTVGETSTPQTAYTTPASSNCQTYPTISNGVNTADFKVVSQAALVTGIATASSSASTTSMSGTMSSATSSASSGRSGAGTSTASKTGSSSSASATATQSATSAALRQLGGQTGGGALGMGAMGLAIVVGALAVML